MLITKGWKRVHCSSVCSLTLYIFFSSYGKLVPEGLLNCFVLLTFVKATCLALGLAEVPSVRPGQSNVFRVGVPELRKKIFKPLTAGLSVVGNICLSRPVLLLNARVIILFCGLFSWSPTHYKQTHTHTHNYICWSELLLSCSSHALWKL